MAQLSNTQEDIIYDLLVDNGVSYESLQIDLVDHICCMVEQKMDNGLDFSQSLTLSTQEFGLSNFAEIQEATLYLLTLKLNKMKKVIGIIGIISAALVISGVLFKINHFPGAGMMLSIGTILISFLIFPSMAFFDIKKGQNNWQKLAVISGYAAAVLLSTATLFKVMHWPGFLQLYYPGLFLLIVVFLPLFTFRNYKTAENKIMAFSKSALILAGVVVFWGIFPILMDNRQYDASVPNDGQQNKVEDVVSN